MKFRKPNHQFRINEYNLFKWTKQGIILTIGTGFNKRIINLNDNISKDRNGTLDFLYSLLDNDIPNQQKNDIKEVINYYIEE
jgi:hypothetical protein